MNPLTHSKNPTFLWCGLMAVVLVCAAFTEAQLQRGIKKWCRKHRPYARQISAGIERRKYLRHEMGIG